MKRPFLLLIVLLLGVSFAQADLGGRTLRVGSDTTYPPFETVNQDGDIVGFDVDVVNAICERIDCEAEFVTTAWDGIFPALAEGQFDMVASGVSITPERDEIVDFSDPYLVVSQAITMRVEDEGLTEADFTADDADLVLGAQLGTTNAQLGEELVGQDRLRLYDTFNSAVQALLNGDVDGVIIDGVTADAFAQQHAGDLVVGIRGLTSDPLGLVFQEGDPLVFDFDEGLAEIREDGTLDDLVAKWFGPEE
ncbi:MAG: basic amino acid ABC transporter substrate-binding protein [Trueperaceae bacterium]|nr:basic amino acid ABC transporter substrate-binding protein [Trueperaceae bacterium]